MVRNVRVDWAVILLLAPVALELLRQALGWRFGVERLFFLYIENMSAGWVFLVVLTTVLCVATPIKIWNNARIEHRLQEQEKLLLTARVEALASQINPHFLFNTLTSIQSLIRTNPETARTVVVKLSGLLRRLLRSGDHFVTLREELESIDEYLDIEVIRFGPQLKVDKQISPDTLDVIVPSMILQPLIENSIKHGFSRKVGGGRIVVRSARQNGHAIIEVEDDGMGMTEERMNTALTDGIGLSNVNERLSVIYGAAYRVRITSVPNLGTIIRLEIPDMVSAERVVAG
jgi:two-component system LytT family sensor kinase